MPSLGRREVLKFLKSTSILAGASIIAGFPSLFSVANAGDPPKPTNKSKKTVSPAKPPTKKPPTVKPPPKPPTVKPPPKPPTKKP
jgi:hypothetical protein